MVNFLIFGQFNLFLSNICLKISKFTFLANFINFKTIFDFFDISQIFKKISHFYQIYQNFTQEQDLITSTSPLLYYTI
jgi:hypothetical protein